MVILESSSWVVTPFHLYINSLNHMNDYLFVLFFCYQVPEDIKKWVCERSQQTLQQSIRHGGQIKLIRCWHCSLTDVYNMRFLYVLDACILLYLIIYWTHFGGFFYVIYFISMWDGLSRLLWHNYLIFNIYIFYTSPCFNNIHHFMIAVFRETL